MRQRDDFRVILGSIAREVADVALQPAVVQRGMMDFSSTMGARAKFRITPFLRISLRRASFTRPRVSGVSGTCTEMMSERTNRSSSDKACSTLDDSCQARCTVICGS